MPSKELPIPELNPVAKMMFPEAQNQIDAGKCPLCGAEINGRDDFKDQLSIDEYLISGMCMKCQDKTFE